MYTAGIRYIPIKRALSGKKRKMGVLRNTKLICAKMIRSQILIGDIIYDIVIVL